MDSNAYKTLLTTIAAIKAGDNAAREKLMEDYKPFIMKTANKFCQRMLQWGHDDELSIGLIAFNSAIDAFDIDRQIPFLSFCRVVIINRLKDFARQEGKHPDTYSLNNDDITAYTIESQTAWEDYLNRTIEDERREEIQQFEKALAAYSISFDDLVEVSPRHRDYRKTLFGVAQLLIKTSDLMEYLNKKKQLPLNELEKISGVKRKTLERGRKFIIASALILNRPDQYIYLHSFINFNS